VRGGLLLEEGDVAQRVGALVDGEVGGVGGAAARCQAGVDLDDERAVVEAHGLPVGAGAQGVADEAGGERVEGLGDLGVLVAGHLGLGSERHVVGGGGCRQEGGLLLGLELLEREPLGARVAAQAVLVVAPVAGVGAGLREVVEVLAAEAIIPDRGDGPLHASFIGGPPDPRGVDVEAPRLGVLEEGGVEERLERVGALDDRRGVIGDERPEDAPKELPGHLARLDRRVGGLLEAGVDEAMTGADGGEDPGPEAAALGRAVGFYPPHPAGIELDFLAGLAVGHRDRRGAAPEAELGDVEAVQRSVGDHDVVATAQELADLGEPHPLGEQGHEEDAVLLAQRPRVAAGALGGGGQGGEHGDEALLRERARSLLPRQAAGRAGPEVAADGLGVESELPGDRLLAEPSQPQPQHFLDFQHRDLAIGHPPLLGRGVVAQRSRGRQGGKGAEKPQLQGGAAPVGADRPVRFLDAFVAQLDLAALGFQRAVPAETGRPGYDPGDLLRLYLYGYLYRVRSSRRLEQETHRNVALMWLLRRLTPDFKTIADFRRDHPEALKGVGREFVLLCRRLDLFGGELREKIAVLEQRRAGYAALGQALAASGETAVSLTDADSRPMMSGSRIEVCYNVQTAVDAKRKLISCRGRHQRSG
jgi:transposase